MKYKVLTKNGKMNKKQQQCWDAAQTHIDREDQIALDVCIEYNQILGNVKHMPWFRIAVANTMIDEMATYKKLPYFLDDADKEW